ncbi:MAG: hypothetical protein QXN59_01660 [Candidatus Micrarchaeaceae archaeon]
MVLTYTRDYANSLTECVEHSVTHLISGVKENGFISASRKYPWYYPHWFRDSNFVAMALLKYYGFAKDNSEFLYQKEAFDAADRIIRFNSRNILIRIGAIGEANHKPTTDSDFYSLRFHIPARLDENGMLCDKHFYVEGREFSVVDCFETSWNDSWLRQFDSIPLTLLALKEEYKVSGSIPRSPSMLLGRYSNELVKYLSKIYSHKSSNAWEMDLDKKHSYDFACIYAGLKVLEYFSEKNLTNIKPEYVMDTFYKYNQKDPISILKDTFVVNGVLTRYTNGNSSSPNPYAGVDSSEIFIFSRFTNGELGQEIEKNTIEKILSDRFGPNQLPTRYEHDVYFTGGRWPLLALEMASYMAKKGNIAFAEEKVNYILQNYFDSMPEQVLIAPESPGNPEGLKDIERNNGETIKELEWNYAEFIEAAISLMLSKSSKQELVRLKRR